MRCVQRLAVRVVIVGGIFLAALLMWPLHAENTETTAELNGTNITYEYSNGRSYNVKFAEAGVSYRYLSGSRPEAWWGPFPYQAMQVDDDTYFASWFEEGYGDYVTLLMKLDEKRLWGSAILRGEEVHFHSAKLLDMQRSAKRSK